MRSGGGGFDLTLLADRYVADGLLGGCDAYGHHIASAQHASQRLALDTVPVRAGRTAGETPFAASSESG